MIKQPQTETVSERESEMTKIRLWLVGCLLGRQGAVVRLDQAAHYLILYNPCVFPEHAMSSIVKIVSGVAIPVRMELLPEGSKIQDTIAFYQVGSGV